MSNDDYVRYIDRTREYYLSEGYEKPYEWAHFDVIPFAPLKKPLSQCRVGLVTTSDIATLSEKGEREEFDKEALVGNVYSIPWDIPIGRLYSRSEHYDRVATNLDDVNSYCPITRLQECVAKGRIGGVAPRFHGVYTAYSKRKTMEMDAPEVLRRCVADGVDVVLLTPI
jgi:Glycine/sarcosine/betaine reductase selenoprotein B (GRDB)